MKHSIYKLTWVNGQTYTDEPNIEFDNMLKLIAHVNKAYPDHTSYNMIVIRRLNERQFIPQRNK